MTSLSAQHEMREVVVHAENWLAALRQGREQLGETGGVPPGASCVMSERGEVTILDGGKRRRYLLTRTDQSIAASSAPAAGHDAQATSLHETHSTPPPVVDPASGPTPVLARPTTRPPAAPHTLDLAAAHAAAAAAVRSARAKQTLAFSAERADALRREYETALISATVPTTSARPSSASPTAQPSASPATAGSSAPASRAATPAPTVGRAQATRTPAHGSGGGASGSGVVATRSRPDLRALAGGTPVPAPASVSREKSERIEKVERTPVPGRSEGLITIASRDLDPTPDSPLIYRERAFMLSGSAERVRLEVLLHGELARLRRELSSRPRGQFINLAVFDHRFEDTPERPPIATLEWRDWRGDAVFTYAVAAPPARSTRSAPVVAAPAPATRERGTERALPPPAILPGARSTTLPVAGPASRPARATSSGALRVPAPAARGSSTQGSSFPAPAPGTWPPAKPVGLPPPAPGTWPPPPRSTREASPSASAPGSWPHPAPEGRSGQFSSSELADERSTVRGSASVAAPSSSPQTPSASPHPVGDTDAASDGDQRLATAFEALPELYFLPTPVAGLEFTVQLLTRLVPCEAISSCLYDINTDEFRFVALTGCGALDRQASAIPSSVGAFGAAKRSGKEALVIADALAEESYEPGVDGRAGLAVVSLAYAPVRYGNQLLGMLQLINAGQPTGFTPMDIAVLTYIAGQLAEFLASRRSLV